MKEEKTMNETYSDERRNFLKTLAVIGGTAASLSAVAGKKIIPHSQVRPEEKKLSGGYRETDHIKKYYKTAGI